MKTLIRMLLLAYFLFIGLVIALVVDRDETIVEPVQVNANETYPTTIGTSFKVRYKGRIFSVTNAHVCESVNNDARNILINNRVEKILFIDKEHDLCVVDYTGRINTKTVKLTNSTLGLTKGTRVKTAGFYHGGPLYHAEGTIIKRRAKGVEKICDIIGLYQVDCKPMEEHILMDMNCGTGCSGSPVIIGDNELVGVLFGASELKYQTAMVPKEYLIKALDLAIWIIQ